MFLLAWCYYKTSKHKNAESILSKLDLLTAAKSQLAIKSTFKEHNRFYIWGKVCDHLYKHDKAITLYERALDVIENKETLNVDYTDLKKLMIKQRLGFSMVLSTRHTVASDPKMFFERAEKGLVILKEVEPFIPKKHQIQYLLA